MAAWEQQMDNGWKGSAGVQKHRQQNVCAKPLLELIWETPLPLVRNGSNPGGSGNGVRHLQWWHKAHHMGRGQCTMLQHLGFC